MKFQTKYLFEDFDGKQINFLTPIRENPGLAKDGSKLWDFKCVCGNVVTETPYRVISGHIKSCGCMRYKRTKESKPRTNVKKRTRIEDYIGRKSHRLTVTGIYIPEGNGRVKLECKCDCGNEKPVYVFPYQFDSGKVQSCGCARFGHSECHKGNTSRRTHNMTNDRFYIVWRNMVRRCYNDKVPVYKNYGARGIEVCEEWRKGPVAFVEWCRATYPKDGQKYTVDRIDVNGNYCPENCRWATQTEQMQNTRYNRNITLFGETKCITQWCRNLDIPSHSVYRKVKRGMSFEDAILELYDKRNAKKNQSQD